ncbi:MAG TPA: sulfatase-like hydrolase/transferase, partial [Planctomycetaceae bacterium]|nr:sulfatase-like hydrolase/transferase [Planctomycetaceae bacterium]
AAWITGSLLVWILSSLMVAWFEFGIFWNLPLLLFTMNLSAFDQTLVVWTLLARTLLVTSPAMLVIAASHWSGRFPAVRVIAWGWHLFVLTWLLIDCGLQCVTGASLWHYVDKAMMTEDLTVGGDISAVTEGVQAALWIMGVRILLLAVGCFCAMRIWLISPFQKRLPRALTVVSVMSLLIIPGIVGARVFVGNPHSLEQLHGAMAFRTWLFHPDRIADYGAAAFGKACNTEFCDVTGDLRKLCEAPRPSLHPSLRVAVIDVPRGVAQRPNIVILFTESFRHNVLTPERLPRLSRWADRSLVGERHFTGSNCSELGAFGCIYSRIPLCYDDTLDQQIPSEAFSIWHQLGYQRQAISSCSANFCRMNEFIGPLNFDRVTTFAEQGNPWHDNDRQTLSTIADEVKTASSPQFIFSILMATHYSYDYPPEFDIHPPASVPPLPPNPGTADLLRDRYFKALAFLDAEFDQFLTSVADTNTIVVITGDHGESFLDDGFLCHGTRLSDIQSRTPLMIFGPNVEPRRLTVTSSHFDLMPTLLDLAGAGEHVLEQIFAVGHRSRGAAFTDDPVDRFGHDFFRMFGAQTSSQHKPADGRGEGGRRLALAQNGDHGLDERVRFLLSKGIKPIGESAQGDGVEGEFGHLGGHVHRTVHAAVQ